MACERKCCGPFVCNVDFTPGPPKFLPNWFVCPPIFSEKIYPVPQGADFLRIMEGGRHGASNNNNSKGCGCSKCTAKAKDQPPPPPPDTPPKIPCDCPMKSTQNACLPKNDGDSGKGDERSCGKK